MKFVVYEIWTRARVVEAESQEKAFEEHEPLPQCGPCCDDLNLANWHVVSVSETAAHKS